MAAPFIGEIRMFAGNFAPQGWAFCDGQLLLISQYDALFSLFGTAYGGDGRTTFGLPDLRGRVPIHWGSGPGLSPRQWGERAGSESVSVNVNQLPQHSHTLHAVGERAGRGDPSSVFSAAQATAAFGPPENLVPMATDTISSVGGSQAHPNVQPFLVIHFIVSLFGIYPSRN